MLPLSLVWTHHTEFPIEAGISELWDAIVPVVSEAHFNTVCSFLPQHEPEEPVSASRCGTRTYHVINGLERPKYGSRLRTGFTGLDFRDPGASLCCYTTYCIIQVVHSEKRPHTHKQPEVDPNPISPRLSG